MADQSGSYKSSHNVSHRTTVIRRAKDEDARRLAEKEESSRLSDAVAAKDARSSASTRVRRSSRDTVTTSRSSGRTVSGRTVVVRREGGISGRLPISTRISGPQTSVKVTGGDTIIRYQSGDMVVKRGARRAQLRRQVVWGYALGYLLLFGCYLLFLFTGTASIEPMDFVEKGFARRHSADVADLERAALEAMRGNRTPAELRLAENLSFYDENHDTVQVGSGDRLTLLTAAKLGRAILEDQSRPASNRTFARPIRIYKESYLSTVNWPYWMTAYNAFGFFLLLGLFLWRPIQNYLGTQGKKTAIALRKAREAQEEADDFRDKYRALANILEEQGEKLRDDVDKTIARNRTEALENANRQAESITGGIEYALRVEAERRIGNLSEYAAREACGRARKILEKRLGQDGHDAAIDELIADIGRVRLDERQEWHTTKS